MKKSIAAFGGVLALVCSAAVYMGFSKPVRGSGLDAVFLSTARPALEVKASPGFMPVSHGKMTVPVAEDRSLARKHSATVWYGLQAHDEMQLVVSLAESDELDWYPGLVGRELESIPILYTSGGDEAGSVTQRVFIRPAEGDPWTDAFAQKGLDSAADLMVSQYEWIVSNGKDKVLIEYREPCGLEAVPVLLPEQLRAFIQRANTSFSAHFVGNGTIPASQVTPWGWNHEGVSSRLLGTVLGSMQGRMGSS
ncbi:DUF4851 domain-containing protein [uncultured Mailhella sp.]|uniref:DUF4851 domain-containing protein n=1 Tax=uncultured Mailhella sp. TaxID=1981031 RepID=UPI002602BA21|nr:DUF4851 domain-containing protein [uncultured Mailhella sp.]